MDEVAMLQGAGKERALRRTRLELGTVVTQADDHGARIEIIDSLEQQPNALVLAQLPEVADRRPLLGEERGQAPRVAAIRGASVTGLRTAVRFFHQSRD